ncbi:nucleotidyltransferase domain-containing protein [Thermoanaerobacteraceae bacterium SP2]|nr:nucleotidyltransferase domain-containing protein [Thermoanaerobacteraceae bacterium SP2]
MTSVTYLKWPDLNDVLSSLDKWAKRVLLIRRDIVKIGYFGSYARKDWGVGSDLDLVVVVTGSGRGGIKGRDTFPDSCSGVFSGP